MLARGAEEVGGWAWQDKKQLVTSGTLDGQDEAMAKLSEQDLSFLFSG